MENDGTMADITMSDRPKDRVHHTVTACVRCRQRKTRCDATLPRCEPCERSNSHCEYYDSAKNKVISRSYITSLQDTVRRLQNELKELDQHDSYEPDHEAMAKQPGLVKFSQSVDSRFLGPSSGIAITRFVMEFAKKNVERKSIREVVPDHTAEEIKQTFDVESAKPTSKIYPLISSVAAPNLPNRGLMEQLLNIYMIKAQYALPLLHEPTFRQQVDMVYNGVGDPTLNFQVRMVIAISMQKLDTQYAGLADSYYLAALPFLTGAIERRDISTLQCFVLMAQYSLLTPTRTAAYWVVGLAVKLSQDLGLCDEKTIDQPTTSTTLNFLEIDMRRRLFWIITSLEYGLSHSLGRPSAFGVTVDNINVGWFQLCDDRFITPDGLLPGHHQIMKKCIAVHFFKMRLLQAEIRRTLYLRKRDTPTSDQDPWFSKMLTKVDTWLRDTPKNDEGSGMSPAWFEGRKNTMIVFMYRPSPQIPDPSPEAAEKCFQAAAFNIGLQKTQVERNLIDITWIFTQAIFMAVNTILWSISYPQIRKRHPVEEVRPYIENGLQAIELCADRWPGVRSAHQLYSKLVQACLKSYDSSPVSSSRVHDGETQGSGLGPSPQQPSSTRNPSSSGVIALHMPQSPQSYHSQPTVASSVTMSNEGTGPYDQMARQMYASHPATSMTSQPNHDFNQYSSVSPPELSQSLAYSSPTPTDFTDPYSTSTAPQLPSWETLSTAPFSQSTLSNMDLPMDQSPWLASFGHDPMYMGQSGIMPYQMQSLTQQDQLDLMASLEKSHLPDLSNLASDSTTSYIASFP